MVWGTLCFFNAICGIIPRSIRAIQIPLWLCTYSQCVSNLLSSFSLARTPVIMSVDLQGHVHSAMSGKILDLFDIQTRLKQSGNVGVPQNVSCDMLLRDRKSVV